MHINGLRLRAGPSTGDWFRVERLLRESDAQDAELREAADRIGRYYSDRHKWGRAAKYYTQVRVGRRRGFGFRGVWVRRVGRQPSSIANR